MRRALATLAFALLVGAGLPSTAAADPTTITTVPGTIEDASATRVLYSTADGHLVIRDVSDPDNQSDEEVPIPPVRELDDTDGEVARLIPGGALYATYPTGQHIALHIHEWRDGVTTDLGEGYAQSIVVTGNYAIWVHGEVLKRRDFTTSPATDLTVATDAGPGLHDVAANGDVFYWDEHEYDVHRWRVGEPTTTLSTTSTTARSEWVRTDGTTSVYRRTTGSTGFSILKNDGDDDTAETTLPNSTNPDAEVGIFGPWPDRNYRVSGGWIAYTGSSGREVRTLAPDGTPALVAPSSVFAITLIGLNPAGQVMYNRHDSDGWRLLLATGSAPAFPVEEQPCCGQRFEWRSFFSGGDWYVVRRDALIRLDLDTAITSGPADFDTHNDAVPFELASTSPNPSFTCTLDSEEPAPCDASFETNHLDDGPHTLTVSSTDQDTDENDTTAATRAWTVDTSPPDEFSLASPADLAAVAEDTPTLSWSSATDSGSGIDSYEVKIDGQHRGTNAAGATTLSAYGALPEGEHTWQVIAKNRAGLTRTSATRTFTVDLQAPSAPELVAPEPFATSTDARPTFTWNGSTDVGTGIVGYDVEIDTTTTRVGADARSFTPSADISDGDHFWRAVAVDAAGNRGRPVGRWFSVDTRPPTAHLSASPNPTLAGDTVQFDAGGTTAGGGALGTYEWDLDGDGSYETDTGASATASRAYDSPADVPVAVRVTDSVGRTDTDEVLLHVTPAPLPGPIGISINDGDQYTNDRDVTITARWPHFATSMIAANDGGFAGADSVPVAAHFDWRLDSSGAERLPKTVYVRFQGGLAGNETYADDIILDETAPQVLSASAVAVGKRRYVAHVRGRDGLSGLASLQVTSDRAHPGPRHRYARTLSVASSHRLRWARVIDRAGNRSRWHALKLRRR